MGEEEKEMSAKEYLESIGQMEKAIAAKRNFIRILREMAESPSSTNLSGTSGSANPSDSQIERITCMILEAEQEIKGKEQELQQRKDFLMRMINTLEEPACQSILIERYFNHLPWNLIAEKMFFSKRWLYKLKLKAFSELDEKLK